MTAYKISSVDSWYYTGITNQQYEDAKVKGFLEPINLGEQVQIESGISMGLEITVEEAFIDGFIEGYLTRIYGGGKFAKVSIRVPAGTLLYEDAIDPDTNLPLSYVITISIPFGEIILVDAWEAGPELAEAVICEYHMEEEFGKRLPPVEPGSD